MVPRDAHTRTLGLPVIAALAARFQAAGWSDAAALLWLASLTGWLDGAVPADLLAGEPERVVWAVEQETADSPE